MSYVAPVRRAAEFKKGGDTRTVDSYSLRGKVVDDRKGEKAGRNEQ